MIVTVDGPAGAGKSSVSREAANRLGFAFLDTGALYRTVALAAEWDGADPEDLPALEAWLTRVDISVKLDGGRFSVLLQGRDVEPFIRNERIGGLASRFSALTPVRAFLLELQRSAAKEGDLVAEGRDMGSVVFPDAGCKFFLTASPEERAKRRLKDLRATDPEVTLESVMADMAQRDQRDAGRKLSPLAPAPDALVVDTSDMNREQVIAYLIEAVNQAKKKD